MESLKDAHPRVIQTWFGYARDGLVSEMRSMLARDIPADVPNGEGHTALSVCAYLGHAEAAALLIEAGADPIRSHHEGRPIDYAVHAGRVDVLKAMSKPEHMNAKGNGGCAPLLWAVEYGQVDCALFLIQAGADLLSVDDEGRDAVALGARKGRLPMMMALADAGCSLEARPDPSIDPLSIAVRERFPDMAAYIRTWREKHALAGHAADGVKAPRISRL